MPDSNLFDTKAAADYIGHSAGTLQNWRVAGEGPVFIKPRKKVFYRKKDLEAWLVGNVSGKTLKQAF